ncbi:hypothetical protein Val02_29290 [Virgisporangium aliadipatigenens]|uniref:Uncharacterized protein n=1 Tax=Virgisporangium aliadipatigenens TaxID=741659 RepID=A0A8J3YLN4_9ACTN|nr:hypothetical protein Val02_29290 [Virgisporangium aliadipatigenens]
MGFPASAVGKSGTAVVDGGAPVRTVAAMTADTKAWATPMCGLLQRVSLRRSPTVSQKIYELQSFTGSWWTRPLPPGLHRWALRAYAATFACGRGASGGRIPTGVAGSVGPW